MSSPAVLHADNWSDKLLHEYNENGYIVLRDFLPDRLMDSFERGIISFLSMQSRKLGLREAAPQSHEAAKVVDELVIELDQKDRPALSAAMTMARNSPGGQDILGYPALREVSSLILKCPQELLVFSGPSCFQNIPAKKDRLYTWHSELSWYPKRRNFINLWFPVFRGKASNSGTMRMLKGSHTTAWDFAEFHGFDKSSEGDSEFLLQYEVPPSEVVGFDQEDIVAERGDLVIFNRNCVHTSKLNLADLPSYAATIRVFDYRRDLTISADWAERPYRIAEKGSSGGRAQLHPLES